jgi:hypothetical protein
MWTESAHDAELVRNTVSDAVARRLLYQARVNLELFTHVRAQLTDALNELNAEDFARVMSDHMTEGVFGADKHRANQMTQKERVIGFLLATVTAGHRLTRFLCAARRNDRGRDWATLRIDLDLLEKQYHDVRNYLEHMDEAIASGKILNDMDCTFTPAGVLTCKEGTCSLTFDFSEAGLKRPQEVYDKVIAMLKSRGAPIA